MIATAGGAVTPPADGQSGLAEDARRAAISPQAFCELAFAGVPYAGLLNCEVERFARGDVVIRLPWGDLLRRPGGTISGPALMALADVTLYGLVLSAIGRVELAVTTSLHVHFLRPARPADVLAEGRLLRLGRRLAVGEVEMRTDGDPEPICHVTGTYAIPSDPRQAGST